MDNTGNLSNLLVMSIDQARAVPTETFGLRLKIARWHAGDITIAKAAELCDLKPATWSTWERGVANPPHMRAVCLAVAEGLGVDVEWLMRGGPLGDASAPTSSGLYASVA